MNHAGEIAPLARLARPHVAVITTIAAAHVGNLGSMEAIADEKASIMQGLEPDGVAVLPLDSAHFARLRAAAGAARIISFGVDTAADVRLLDIEPDADGSHVRLADVRPASSRLRAERAGPAHGDERAGGAGRVAGLGLDPARCAAGAGGVPSGGRARRSAQPDRARRTGAAAGRKLQRQRRLDARGAGGAAAAAGAPPGRGARRHARTRRRRTGRARRRWRRR